MTNCTLVALVRQSSRESHHPATRGGYVHPRMTMAIGASEHQSCGQRLSSCIWYLHSAGFLQLFAHRRDWGLVGILIYAFQAFDMQFCCRSCLPAMVSNDASCGLVSVSLHFPRSPAFLLDPWSLVGRLSCNVCST